MKKTNVKKLRFFEAQNASKASEKGEMKNNSVLNNEGVSVITLVITIIIIIIIALWQMTAR